MVTIKTISMPVETAKKLDTIARRRNTSKSGVIQEEIESAYERLKDKHTVKEK
jgi:predicted transcriptional regulator